MRSRPSSVEAIKQQVPPDSLAAEASAVLRRHSEPVFSRLTVGDPIRLYGVDSGFFYLPLLLAEEFGGVTQEDQIDLGVSLAIGHAHFAIMDRVLDEQVAEAPFVLSAQIMLAVYLRRMEQQFGDLLDVRKWHWSSYEDYAVAAIEEYTSRWTVAPVTEGDLSILGAKSAPISMPLRAVLSRAGRGERLQHAEDALIAFSGGLQLLDDLSDLEADFRDGLSSVPLRLLFHHVLGLGRWPAADDLTGKDLKPLAVLSGVHKGCLLLADARFANVEREAEDLGLSALGLAASQRRAGIAEKLARY